MYRFVALVVAVLAVGCDGVQSSPVAPTVTAPAPAPPPMPPGPAPSPFPSLPIPMPPTPAPAPPPSAPAPFDVELRVSRGQSEGGYHGVTARTIVTPDFRFIDSYNYDFGDGTQTGSIDSSFTTHYYTRRDTYTVSVTVRHVDGRVKTASTTATIE